MIKSKLGLEQRLNDEKTNRQKRSMIPLPKAKVW